MQRAVGAIPLPNPRFVRRAQGPFQPTGDTTADPPAPGVWPSAVPNLSGHTPTVSETQGVMRDACTPPGALCGQGRRSAGIASLSGREGGGEGGEGGGLHPVEGGRAIPNSPDSGRPCPKQAHAVTPAVGSDQDRPPVRRHPSPPITARRPHSVWPSRGGMGGQGEEDRPASTPTGSKGMAWAGPCTRP